MQNSFAFGGSRAISKAISKNPITEFAAVKAVPSGARLPIHNTPNVQQASLAPTTPACYAALMPASISSTWSYDFADTLALDSPSGCAAGSNGGGFGGNPQGYPAGDDGWCGQSMCASDDCESFGSSETSSTADNESTFNSTPSCFDSSRAERLASSSTCSGDSMMVLLSAEVMEQFKRWSNNDDSSSCFMEMHECR